MADKQHWTAAQVVEALTKNKGMVYYAAKSLGCSHTTIYNYAKRYASVREVMEAQGWPRDILVTRNGIGLQIDTALAEQALDAANGVG